MKVRKRKSTGLAIGGAALITGGFFALRRYVGHRRVKAELDCIPWELPDQHTSWKLRFGVTPIVKTTRYRTSPIPATRPDPRGRSSWETRGLS